LKPIWQRKDSADLHRRTEGSICAKPSEKTNQDQGNIDTWRTSFPAAQYIPQKPGEYKQIILLT